MPYPVSLQNIAIHHQSTPIVEDLSLHVNAGEFLVLLGPSGCGKSTLLNAIAGLHPISSGSIAIGDKDVTQAEPNARDIAMVFQSYALYPTMTVFDNLAFALKVAGVHKATVKQRVATIAELLQLTPWLKVKPAQLSGGQRQRVAIGRALVREKPVLLFDEPLSNLDAKLRNELRLEIKRLHRQLASTIVYVTHDQMEAMTLADRIVVMNQGRIEQIGTPQQIYQQPINRFVAEFIGSPTINLMEGIITLKQQQLMFECGEFQLILAQSDSDAARAIAQQQAPVTLAIRPEAIVAHACQQATLPQFTLELMEQTGPETLLWCTGYQHRWAVKAHADFQGRPGAPLWLALDTQCCVFFDAVTGKRLDALAP